MMIELLSDSSNPIQSAVKTRCIQFYPLPDLKNKLGGATSTGSMKKRRVNVSKVSLC